MVRNLLSKLICYTIELNNKGKDLLQCDLALSDSIFLRDDVHLLSAIKDVNVTYSFFFFFLFEWMYLSTFIKVHVKVNFYMNLYFYKFLYRNSFEILF